MWHLPMGIERLVAQLRILHGQQNSPAYGEAANRVVRWEHASAGPQGLREPAVWSREFFIDPTEHCS